MTDKSKQPAPQRPRGETHVRTTFSLSREVVRELQLHVYAQKLRVRKEDGGPSPTQSEFVEAAVRAALKRRKRRG